MAADRMYLEYPASTSRVMQTIGSVICRQSPTTVIRLLDWLAS